jgi:hypothetical protein
LPPKFNKVSQIACCCADVVDNEVSHDIGYGFEYPLNARVTPLQSYVGVIFRRVLCHHGYTNVGVFAADDDLGSREVERLLQGLPDCPLNVLAIETFPSSTIHFSSQIAAMKAAGVKIFVTFLTPSAFAPLMEQGYAAGLFDESSQVFGGLRVSDPAVFSAFKPTSDIASLMKGYIGVNYWPSYPMTYLESGKNFITRWREQAYTGPDNSGICDNTRDDAAINFLYRDSIDKSHCYGLNFSSYHTDGSDISPYAALTYDATILLLSGYHTVIQDKLNYSAYSVVNAIRDVSFDGASGPVKMDQGPNKVSKTAISTYSNNVRSEGLFWKIVNFDADAYKINPQTAFKQVFQYSSKTGIQPCTPDMGCIQTKYRSASNTPPSDTRPTLIIALDPAVRGLLFALGAILWLMAIATTVFLYVYRKAKLIKASQGPIMWFIVLGECFGGARVINAALDITDATCQAGIWMGHLAFFFVFGVLFLKTWRVDRLVNSKALKRVKITTTDVLKMLFAIQLAVVVYLAMLSYFGNPHQSYVSHTASNQTTHELRCAFVQSGFHTALFAIEALILMVGLKLCWATKDVPDAVNEAKFIAMAITSIFMISLLVFPVVFLLNLPPATQQLIASVSFAFAGYLTTGIIFGPKMLSLVYYGEDLGSNMEVQHKANNKIAPEGAAAGFNQITGTFVRSTVAMKKMSHDQRVVLCRQQVAEWEALLMHQIEMNTTDSNGKALQSNPGSRVSSLNNASQGGSEAATGDAFFSPPGSRINSHKLVIPEESLV